MSPVIHWFRQDLRLSDHPALRASCASALTRGLPWLPVFVWDPAQARATRWVDARMGPHRRLALHQALTHLDRSLRAHGHRLLVLQGEPAQAIGRIASDTGAAEVWTEHLPAPQEEAADRALSSAAIRGGWRWERLEQGGLFAWDDLPFDVQDTPDVFTSFRQAIQRAGLLAREPVAPPPVWPHPMWPRPLDASVCAPEVERWPEALSLESEAVHAEPRASFPITESEWHIGESIAQAHWSRYLSNALPHRYKSTRNGLQGHDFSTKLSPWLAWGAMSARQAQHALQRWETEHGASESSGWITFELLWREHFRLLHAKHGRRLYQPSGLSGLPHPTHDAGAFMRWCAGRTGHALVDAGMRELESTGWLSNRMRQIVASYLIQDLGGDWRAGAAWFESRLIDFDVFSNQGNWAYIAGRGTDPRGGRRFDPDKQAREHDPDGRYRRMWSDS